MYFNALLTEFSQCNISAKMHLGKPELASVPRYRGYDHRRDLVTANVTQNQGDLGSISVQPWNSMDDFGPVTHYLSYQHISQYSENLNTTSG